MLPNQTGLTKKIIYSLATIIAIVSLIYPALINGFPLVYSDSGSYLFSAADHHVPVDRPIGYSIFIQLSSLSISLWFTILMQAAVIFYLVYLVCKDILHFINALLWSSGIIIILSFLCGISNYTSQIMPDILVSIMLLICAIFLLGKKRSIFSNLILIIIFLFAIISHFSDLLIVTILLGIIICLNFWEKILELKRIILFSILIIVSWLIVPTINYYYNAGFTISRTQNIFLIGRLTQEGIIDEYLHEYCSTLKNSTYFKGNQPDSR